MHKGWLITAIVLIFVGVVTLVALPLITYTKKNIEAKRKVVTTLSLPRETKPLESFPDRVMRSMPKPNKSFFDAILDSYKEILGAVSSTLGILITVKQVFSMQKKKKAPAPVQEKSKKKEPTKH
jgi:hypothetical protein